MPALPFYHHPMSAARRFVVEVFPVRPWKPPGAETQEGRSTMTMDTVLQGGLVVDGTGAAGVEADVGIRE
ncbi:MAG: hypothetical protein ACE5JM_16915, partial [Armatimonadota bacterium]